MSAPKPCERCEELVYGYRPEYEDGTSYWLCPKCKGLEPTKAFRVTMIVEEDALAFLEKSVGYNEADELFYFEKVDEIVEWRFIPCADCGSRLQMEEYACGPDSEYCVDCCHCPEHFPEEFEEQE